MYYLLGYCISYKTTRTNFLMIKRVKLLWTYQQINSTKTVFPEMRGKVIYNSKNSWLVLKTVVLMEVSLFNIVSKDLVQLPQLSSCGTKDICLLLSSPSEGDCCVIFINSSSNTFYYWKPGEGKFHEQWFRVEDCTIVAAIVLRGTIYF